MMERVKPIELTDNDTGKVYTLDFLYVLPVRCINYCK